MGSIGDVFMRLLADATGFEADVVKEAEKAGKAGSATLGKTMGDGFKKPVVQAFGIAASAAFGIATKGALELQNVQVDLQRELGITAEEAKGAASAINDIAGRNVTDIETVSSAYQKVRTDLGLVGKAAETTTELFVKFGRATKQDAGAAVLAFDDILDNWGLTADHANELMDKLIVSHQKYGGSIEQNEKTLAQLAPALRAANFQIDDGIALLGLFGAKGLDAEQASAAFAKSLTKVKSPAELRALIKDIQDTKDPFLRASKAADLFGARAGAKLANALGDANLDDFIISMDEAAGATEKAADVIDSSVSGRIRKAFSEAGAALRGFGADFGPALTGFASIATLGATLFPGIGSKLADGLLKGLKGVGSRIAAAIGIEVASSAAGEVAGEAIAKNLGDGLAKSGAVGDAVAEGLDAAPKSGKLAASIAKLRDFLSTRLGAGLVLGVTVVVAKVITDKLADFQNDQVKDLFAKSNLEGLKNFLQAAKLQLAAQSSGPQGIIAEAAGLNDGLKQNIQEATDAIAELETRGTAALASAGDEMRTEAYKTGATIPGAIAKGFGDAAPTVRDHFNRSLGDIVGGRGIFHKLEILGADAAGAFAQGITDARNKPLDAFTQLTEMLKHPLTRTAEVARLSGQLISKELAAGLKSNDPAIRAQAIATKGQIVDRLKELQRQGAPFGKAAMEELRKGIKSKDPDVRRAAYDIYKTIKANIDKAKPAGTAAGKQAGKNVAAGLRGQTGPVGEAAAALARRIGISMIAALRATAGIGGRGGAASDPDIHGKGSASGGPVRPFTLYPINETGQEGFIPTTPGLVVPHDLMQSLRTPRATGWDGAMARPAPAVGGDTYNFNIPLPGVLEVRSAEDIVRPLRQLAAVGTFERSKRFVTANRRPVRG